MDPLIDAYFKAYRIGKYEAERFQSNIYFAGFEWYLSTNDKIVIYGAGHYGKMLLSFITERGLYDKVVAFVVTDITNCPENYNGIPIKAVAELSEKIKKENIIVILSVDICYQSELSAKCDKLGIVNRIRVDKTILHFIKAWMDEEV